MNRSGEGTSEKVRTAHNPLQWGAAVVSLLLLLAVIGVLVADGLAPDRPAGFEIHIHPPRQVTGEFHLPLSIRNTGDQTVAGLGIRVELMHGDSVVADGAATLDWLPARSVRGATVVFGRDPRAYRVVARVEGYRLP